MTLRLKKPQSFRALEDRGTAKTMLIPLGEKATVIEILDKLNILFGEVSNNGMIMQ